MPTARYAEPTAVDDLMQWIERCGWEGRLRSRRTTDSYS